MTKFPKAKTIFAQDESWGFFDWKDIDAWYEEMLRFIKSFEDAWDNGETNTGDVEDFLIGLHERLKK